MFVGVNQAFKFNLLNSSSTKTKQNIDIDKDNETNNKFDSHLPIQKLDAFFWEFQISNSRAQKVGKIHFIKSVS